MTMPGGERAAGEHAAVLHHQIDGAGPHVVLLHPVGLDLTCFDALIPDLARHFTVLRVDLRGHGRSPSPEPARSLEDYAGDVHALLARIAFAPAAVVGFSFGGMVAQVLALSHPQDVAALIVSACASTLPEQGRRVLAERGAVAEAHGMAAVLDATLTRWFSAELRARGGDQAIRDRLLAQDPRSWADAWRAMAAVETAPRLSEIRVPTLCLAGGADVSAPPDTVLAIANSISGARFEVIPEAAHMLFIEKNQEVTAATVRFLSAALRSQAAL